MRQKVYNALNRIYGVMMFISFFAGFIPLVPFAIAILVGGSTGERLAVFLYRQYYPWVIVLGSVAILIGLAAMYVGKKEGLSVKKVAADSKQHSEKAKKEKSMD